MLFTNTQGCRKYCVSLSVVMPQGEEHTKDYPETARKMSPLGQEGPQQHTAPVNGLIFLRETPCSF